MAQSGRGTAGAEYRNRLWRPSHRLLVALWVLLLALWTFVLGRWVQTGQITDPLVVAGSAALGVAVTVAGYFGGNELLRLFADPVSVRATAEEMVVRFEARTGTTEQRVPWAAVDSVSWRRTKAGLAAFQLKSEEVRWGSFLFVTDGAFLGEMERHVPAERLHPLDTG